MGVHRTPGKRKSKRVGDRDAAKKLADELRQALAAGDLGLLEARARRLPAKGGRPQQAAKPDLIKMLAGDPDQHLRAVQLLWDAWNRGQVRQRGVARKTASGRQREYVQDKRVPLQNEFDRRVESGEKSADVIKDLARRTTHTERTMRNIIKPRLRQSNRTVPTVEILQGDGSIAIINKSDFNPKVHTRAPIGSEQRRLALKRPPSSSKQR